MPRVIIVDQADREVGTADKMRVHRDGELHRAFSIFVFRPDGRLLLQQRALSKYHSGGLWSNTCCSHPEPGETVQEAAHRRLREELGFDCELEPAFTFIYRAQLGPALYEHELVHVLVGRSAAAADPDPREVMALRSVPLAQLEREVAEEPERFTGWLAIALRHLLSKGAHLVPGGRTLRSSRVAETDR